MAIPLLLSAAACGGSDDADSDSGDPVDTAPVAVTDPASTDTGMSDTSVGSDTTGDVAVPTMPDLDVLPTPDGGDGTATLTLDNGEAFEFDGVLCALEPQTVSGSEILFSATSYGDPGLDVTQFGDDGTLTGVASVDV